MSKKIRTQYKDLSTDANFKTIFQLSPVSTQIFTLDGTTIMVNKAWEKLWRTKPKDIIGRYNILSDKQLSEKGTMPYIKRAFAGEIVSIPIVKYEPGKTIPAVAKVSFVWVKAVMYPIKNSKGNISHIVLQHEDITQQMVAQQVVTENERKFRSLIEKNTDVIMLMNNKKRIEYISPSIHGILGYTPSEMMLFKNPSKLIHPLDATQVSKAYASLLRHPKSEAREALRLRHKNGTYVYIEAIATNYIADPAVHAVVINFRDVTKQKAYEREMRQSKHQLETILANIADGILVQDKTGKVIYANTIAANMIGRKSAEEIIGITPREYEKKLDLLDEDGNKFLSDQLPGRRVFQGEKNPSVTVQFVDKKTKKIHFAVIKSTGVHANGSPELVINVITDITAQKELDMRKNQFISMASHELKTPVTSIKLFIEVLEKRLADISDKRAKESIVSLKTQANRLRKLVTDLMDISRIEIGKLRFRYEKFRIDELIEETIASLAVATKHERIQLLQKDPAVVYGDRYRIYQVVANLITNAIKYSPVSKPICVKIVKKNDFAQISVEDFGMGVAKKDQQKIFERLYQGTNAEEKTFPGLGIGLFISKEIINRHNGSIWVESTRGKGAIFYFRIPLAGR